MNHPSHPLRILRFFSLSSLMTASTVLSTPPPGYSIPSLGLKDSPKVLVDEVWQIVAKTYVDGTFNHSDWQATRRELLSKDYSSKAQAYEAIRAALKKLNDPYTRFLDPQKFTELAQQTSGELSGIGARLELDKTTKALTVVEAMPNSPAFEAGLKSGDRILAVNGTPVRGLDVEKAVGLIRGKPNTTVKMKISRPGAKVFDVALTRKVIQVRIVTSAVKQEGSNRIGYIRLAEFDDHADEQVKNAIQSLEKQQVKGFILDLRQNPGGLLSMAVEVSRLWIDEGAIVKTVVRDGGSATDEANRTAVTKLPLAVLVDGGSASASEIVTGALKDNRRAIVVGTKTFGKGIVQQVNPLSDGSGLNVTIARYYTPNGADIHHKGILPDVAVPLTNAQAKTLADNPKLIGSPSDPQYAKAAQIVLKQIQGVSQSE
ncbi:S41 family peptidase [Altericista sp. CCNU0014]|uniref:S41 family peptidase n=1 Tax=Altericista sp. CCNU0014 TaxID=3082949 RepID=UPI00384DED65